MVACSWYSGYSRQQLVKFFEAIVRHRGEEMVRQVVILPDRKDGRIDEPMHEEDSGIG